MTMGSKDRVILGGLAALALGGAGVFFVVDPMNLRSPALLVACEDALKEQLRSPSGYKRIETSDLRSRPATLDDVMGWAAGGDKRAADLELASRDADYVDSLHYKVETFEAGAWVHYMILHYDAPNGFNALVRGAVECSVISREEKPSDKVPSYEVRLDGQTTFEKALSDLRAAEGRKVTITKAQEDRALKLIMADPPPPPSEADCAWLKAAWSEKRYSEAMDRFGAPTQSILKECRSR